MQVCKVDQEPPALDSAQSLDLNPIKNLQNEIEKKMNDHKASNEAEPNTDASTLPKTKHWCCVD